MKGIILAGGSGTRLYPITQGVSKQLLPIYDKPMIYYPLSTLMLAGIKDILIITTPEDSLSFKRLLKDGSQFGINIQYEIQEKPDGLANAFKIGKEFIGDDCCAMILGDNIFFGNHFVQQLKEAKDNAEKGFATIFGYKVKDPQRFGIMEFDENMNVIGLEEKPENPKSYFAITGLYFYSNDVTKYVYDVIPSKRGEYEITDLNRIFLEKQRLKSILFGRGNCWFDTGTFDSLYEASTTIKIFQNSQDILICSPEEIAFKNGWINKNELEKISNTMIKNSYGKYLNNLVRREK